MRGYSKESISLGELVDFQIDTEIKPVMQKERRVPLGYQERLSKHLKFLKENKVIERPLN